MAEKAVLVAARRTPVAPRGGAYRTLQADELAAPVLSRLLVDGALTPGDVDQVVLGNALYGGGNPARLAALRAGIPQSVPALTVDTQCCSGLDAIVLGTRLIEAGSATWVIAGGMESFSRMPIRMHSPVEPGDQPVPYECPAFAPPPFADPDLAEAAANLAVRNGISREAQARFAVSSHEKAMSAASLFSDRLVIPPGTDLLTDAFTRALSLRAAMRAPVLTGSHETGLSAATIACEADGAAAVLLVSQSRAQELGLQGLTVALAQNGGGDPSDPALVPNPLGRAILQKWKTSSDELAATELQEAYAVQAMVTAAQLKFRPDTLNCQGGALARGHPIGASGAILVVHLYERLCRTPEKPGKPLRKGLALIAAAGGLASGVALETATGETRQNITH